jgi:hypothetical protein
VLQTAVTLNIRVNTVFTGYGDKECKRAKRRGRGTEENRKMEKKQSGEGAGHKKREGRTAGQLDQMLAGTPLHQTSVSQPPMELSDTLQKLSGLFFICFLSFSFEH